MIFDDFLEFADATAVNAAAGTALIGDVVDLGVAHRDIGNGRPVWFVVTTDTSIITGGTAGTFAVSLVSDAQPALAVDGSATVHVTVGPIATGALGVTPKSLKAGGIVCCVALPLEGAVYERYLGILAVTGTTATTAGKINAFITLDPAGYIDYARAVN